MNSPATYAIRHATMEDLPLILNLRDQAREIMRSYGNTFQWPDGYPYDEKFILDIEQGCSYVMADDKVPSLAPSP